MAHNGPVRTQVAYYKVPTAAEFTKYFKERRFFRVRDVLGLALWGVRRHKGGRMKKAAS